MDRDGITAMAAEARANLADIASVENLISLDGSS